MATKDDIDADLTLELQSNNVTPEKFVKAVRAFFGLVNEVTRELRDQKNSSTGPSKSKRPAI